MLEGLDNIQWETLNHAYGSAEDVPALIRALADDDDDIRDQTLYALYGNIWHQGTVYQATPYAVPFLIELLSAEQVTRKYDILIYLAHLAQGDSYLDVHEVLMSDYMGHDNFQQQLEEELSHVKRTHQVVGDGLEVYFRLLLDKTQDLQTRMAVAYLLACFPEYHTLIVPRLQRLLPDEHQSLMRASLILAMRDLQRGQLDILHLEPYLAPDEDLIVRVCTAMAVAQIATVATPMRVINLLIQVLKNPLVVEELYEQLTWSESDIMSDIGKSLMQVGYTRLEPVMSDMIYVLRRVDFYSAPTYVDALMVILFGGEPIPANMTSGDLTTHQREMLQMLLDSPTIWRIRLNEGQTMLNGNITQIMKAYRLPDHPEKMHDYLSNQGQ